MRSRLRKIPLLLFALFGVASLSGMEVAPDLQKIEPLALLTGEPAMVAAQAKAMGTQGRQTADFGVFVHLQSGNRAFPDKIRALGGEAAQIHDRLYSGTLPADAARYVSRWPEVAYIEAAKMARPMLDVSRPAVSADVVQLGTGLPSAYSGAGTYVGIVDTGIYGSHPDFTGRIAFGFSISPSSDPYQDTDGHGTHVAGIASGDGSSSSGLFTGMAPRSRLLIGKAGTIFFLTSDIIKVMNDILSIAGTTPVAINLSFGLVTGPHDGTSGFESAIDSLATNGVASGQRQIVTVAAGNERTDGEHFQVALPPFGSVNIPLSLKPGGSLIDAWADGADRYTVRATLGSESAVAASGTSASSSGGRISVSNRVDLPPNGATHITVFFTASSATSATVFFERTRNGGNGKMDAYIDKEVGSFTTATDAGTITEPANAENVIAVGSFNTKICGGAGPIGDVSTFSSQGPTRDGRIKPDLTAPGSLIYSARSFEATFLPIEIAPNDNYVILEGTSMSSPHVAGIAALAWESNPLLTSAQMRERLRRTADLPSGVFSPDNTWGHGKVNALRAVTETVAGITVVPPPGATGNAIPPGTPVTLRGDETSSGPSGQSLSYTWGVSGGGSLSSSTGPQTSFSAAAPGVYTVTLSVTLGSAFANSETTTLHVNTVPTAAIAGPATDNVGIPVSFSGAESADPDPGSPPLKLWWVLVSRPSGSSASLFAAGGDNATMTPDFPGVYEVGLRADDGLDNSALVTKTYTTTGVAPPSTGGGGGGGCSIGNGTQAEDGPSSLVTLLLILLPLFVLPARRIGRGHSSPASRR